MVPFEDESMELVEGWLAMVPVEGDPMVPVEGDPMVPVEDWLVMGVEESVDCEGVCVWA